MENRRFIRITSGFDVEITYKGKIYKGVIENLSENGVCIITVPAETAVEFAPGETIELKFQPHKDKTLTMHCKVKWAYKVPTHELTSKIGMEIIDPPWDQSDYFI